MAQTLAHTWNLTARLGFPALCYKTAQRDLDSLDSLQSISLVCRIDDIILIRPNEHEVGSSSEGLIRRVCSEGRK